MKLFIRTNPHDIIILFICSSKICVLDVLMYS